MATDSIKLGAVLAGRYRVETVLGEGGMGIVVAATHIQLGKKVAVKVLRPQFAADEEQAARFSREAHAGVRLTGEHSVHVLDVGQLADGTPYMVMEFLVGADLGEVLTQRKKLMPLEAVDYTLQAAEGIGEAHAHGIIHRDVKPQNLFLTHRADGSPLIKVLDFGLNKDIDNDKTLTKSRTIFGSPYYMSPEQMKASRDVDGRTDIWALGACLYELLVGAPPFEAPTVAELMVKVLQEAPQPPHERAAAVDPGLSAVVLRCLQKNSRGRFPDIQALAAALEPFGSPRSAGTAARISNIFQTVQPGGSLDVSMFPRLAAASSDPLTRTEAAWDSAARREVRLRRSLYVGALVALAVVGLGIGGLTFWGRSGVRRPTVAATSPAPASAPIPSAVEPTSRAVVEPPAIPLPTTAADAGAAIESSPVASSKAAAMRPRPRPTTPPAKPDASAAKVVSPPVAPPPAPSATDAFARP
jgi:eukaryotic-like serine/threonine-protein kinase